MRCEPTPIRFATVSVPVFAGLATLLAARLFAQAPSTSSGGPIDKPFVLGPFEVNTDRDKGFVATSSLAGGRLAGDLKDTPVAYSVLTRDFIDALQLTDLTEMAKWAPNSYDLADNNQTYDTGNAIRISSRGVASNSPQRNFFPVNYNFDSYNIERLDLARGPNAVLFGTSGVGGTTNSVTKRARLERRFTEVRASYGSWQNYRYTLDHNQPLGKSLGVRLNMLFADREGWRDGDRERRKGATLAVTWKVSRQTEIRAEVEKGQSAKAVITTNFDDNISGWNGRSTYRAIIAAADNAAGIARQGARTAVFTPSSAPGTLVNYEGWALTQGGSAAAGVPAGGVMVVGTSANITNNSVNSQMNLPATLYDLAIAGSNFRVPPREASTFASGPNFTVDNEDFTLSATQRVGERFFAELALNAGQEKTDGDIGISRSMTRIYLDVNAVLPTGAANPNYLEPFAQAQSYPYYQTRDKTNTRLALGYVLDRTRWGDFTFNVIGGTATNKFDRNAFRYMLKTNSDPRQWPSFAAVNYRYYLNTDKNRPMPTPSEWTYIDPITRTTTTVPAGEVRDYTNTSFNQINQTDYKYAQVAAVAKLFKGRLNLLGAARRDSFKTHQESIVLQFDNPANWDGVVRNIKPAAPADWASLTYRERDAAGNPFGAVLPAETRPRAAGVRDARYANERFQDDFSPSDTQATVNTVSMGSVFHATKHISGFGNFAQSFSPPSVALKIDGSVFQAVAARGWDYGLRFSFLDGGLVTNLTRYEGREKNRSISSTPLQQNFNAIIQANALNDLTSGGLNSRGLRPVPLGYVDSAEVQTSGWEIEVIANLSRNWRLMLNGATPNAIQTNPNKESLAYQRANETTLKQIVTDAGGTIDANNVARFTATIPPGQSPAEGPNAVIAWNGNQAAIASLASGQKLNRLTERSGNFYTDYLVSEGRLKGLRVGGGVNYRGRQIIGTKGADTIRDPANRNQSIDDPAVGPLDYVYMEPYATGTLTFSYSRRIRQKYTLGFDLKIDNLFDYAKPIYVVTILRPPGGDLTNPARIASPNRFSWATPRNFTFSTSLKF